MRAPSLSRRSRARPVSQADLTTLFKNSEIPQIDIWREFKSRKGLGDLTPEDAFKTATVYRVAATDSSSTWKGALERDHNIDPYTLHYTALPLFLSRVRNAAVPLEAMGLHMLSTASSLGYTPSTLTLMSSLLDQPPESFLRFRQLLRDVESRFKRLLRTENNPDAFTLQGCLLLKDGGSALEALNYFNWAIKAAHRISPSTAVPARDPSNPTNSSSRQPRWTFEGSCHLNRGRILLEQGQADKALASFTVVALELDLADGYVELAKLLPRDTPERETYLLKAAQAGNFEACRLLALGLADKAFDASLPSVDRVRAIMMATEWAQVDPDSSQREGVVAQVEEKMTEFRRERGWLRE
ncbi:hypothetical protein N657DRAFT_634288 [Parathielavia appendiculata]|uniref:Uncharacterized protein n=1 Tax=Parathielavia appendiculata TaxID=2587402 RepID=A0AAN6TYK0_9PEZI|nr:hypothetical protein N657DRAFT_634288 [Parathielavia appendiculata]